MDEEKWRFINESWQQPSYECQRCGAQVSQYMVATHDEFHDSITNQKEH